MGILELFNAFKSRSRTESKDKKMTEIGVITHYFPHVKAAVIKLSKGRLKVGENICLKGHTTDFKQSVKSLQLNRAPIEEGKPGQEIGIKVKSRVRIGDVVYKI